MINLIFAISENWLLGSKNKLPWSIKEDLIHFKKLTKNKNVLIGYNTYLSMTKEYKVNLNYPKVYLVSFDKPKVDKPNIVLVNDLDKFLKNNKEEIFIIGGKSIYEASYKYADNIYITYILNSYKGDVFLKPFNFKSFKLEKYKVVPGLIFTKYRKVK